jgi:uncharacterized protein (DUF362 family)
VQERRDELDGGQTDGRKMDRAGFLKLTLGAAAGLTLIGAGCGGGSQPAASSAATGASAPAASTTAGGAPSTPPSPSASPVPPHLAVAKGKDPAAITRAAVDAVGGMARFVRHGADVIVKPNICTASRSYEYAATTNPVVVATLVKLCLDAGAKRVRVMDSPFSGTPEAAYEDSGIAAAVEKAGGKMVIMSPLGYAATPIPHGRDIKSWQIYRDALKADVLINVPVAKQHGSTVLTLGCKNLMGLVLDRGGFHTNLSQRIADLTSVMRPALTVVDAVRILTANGPTGGSLGDVKRLDTVIASHDVVAADSRAAKLFRLKGSDIGYLVAAHEMGLGTLEVGHSATRTLKIA